ncbi:hypothetical protein [Kribbella italica]|uniref:Uncharacterized protein n=1 Tax=Kribbella italica TaxID=1540520 RepID=A0A7W9JEF3_9ACTN|nr:hypothetical protein [Kribbella italica]MBB5840593.1 hypothetical protein [Kribbella italica]
MGSDDPGATRPLEDALHLDGRPEHGQVQHARQDDHANLVPDDGAQHSLEGDRPYGIPAVPVSLLWQIFLNEDASEVVT